MTINKDICICSESWHPYKDEKPPGRDFYLAALVTGPDTEELETDIVYWDGKRFKIAYTDSNTNDFIWYNITQMVVAWFDVEDL